MIERERRERREGRGLRGIHIVERATADVGWEGGWLGLGWLACLLVGTEGAPPDPLLATALRSKRTGPQVGMDGEVLGTLRRMKIGEEEVEDL
jgi:hypothetical protein